MGLVSTNVRVRDRTGNHFILSCLHTLGMFIANMQNINFHASGMTIINTENINFHTLGMTIANMEISYFRRDYCKYGKYHTSYFSGVYVVQPLFEN